jgi:hypothetical protein
MDPMGLSGTDCNQLARNTGLAGFTYDIATRIWKDGNLTGVANATTIAALAAVTWQGESSFTLNPTNRGNYDNGRLTSIDYGPFQINTHFHPEASGSIIGTHLGVNQAFNGNPDANIAFGIGFLESLYKTWSNTAAGHYVGSLGYVNGKPTLGQLRQNTYDQYRAKLISFFDNSDCFKQSPTPVSGGAVPSGIGTGGYVFQPVYGEAGYVSGGVWISSPGAQRPPMMTL